MYASCRFCRVLLSYVLVQSTAALYMRYQVQSSITERLGFIASYARPTTPRLDSSSPQDSDPEVEQMRQSMAVQQQMYWDAQQAWAASNPRISQSAWHCVFEAVCFPTRSWSQVSITGNPPQPYPAPAELYQGIAYLLAGGTTGLQT